MQYQSLPHSELSANLNLQRSEKEVDD
ncbi:unnamed protein product [Nezara viridula]|uniref:Uncharacterized protein n=1 Tax=Nezara viridula TaxID=85310 RepID=A0A9P0HC23_NEZVI|nr:unnamed protein product [Nezara viridula]